MTAESSATSAEELRKNPQRIPAFVDGTFAIIITILVLEIGVPSDLSEQSLRDALDEIGPTLIAWVISFLLVGMYWVWHRDLFVKVRYVNRDAIWLNILFLLPVCLVRSQQLYWGTTTTSRSLCTCTAPSSSPSA
jgi:uncharacterized membrane protein